MPLGVWQRPRRAGVHRPAARASLGSSTAFPTTVMTPHLDSSFMYWLVACLGTRMAVSCSCSLNRCFSWSSSLSGSLAAAAVAAAAGPGAEAPVVIVGRLKAVRRIWMCPAERRLRVAKFGAKCTRAGAEGRAQNGMLCSLLLDRSRWQHRVASRPAPVGRPGIYEGEKQK